MPGILAIDAATTTGWAATVEGQTAPEMGAIRLVKGTVGDDLGRLYLALRQHLGMLIDSYAPRRIWFEAPMVFNAARTTKLLNGLGATIECLAAERAIPCFEGNVNEVRRHVLGRGRRGDDQKLRALSYCRMRGWRPPGHDAADASILWVYGYACADRSEGNAL